METNAKDAILADLHEGIQGGRAQSVDGLPQRKSLGSGKPFQHEQKEDKVRDDTKVGHDEDELPPKEHTEALA